MIMNLRSRGIRSFVGYLLLLILTVYIFLNLPFRTTRQAKDTTILKKGVLSTSTHHLQNETETEKVNACFVVLIRNQELNKWRKTMQNLEDRFNRRFNYPYVFLSDKPFTEEFKLYTRALTKAKVEFGLIPKEHWSVPSHIDNEKFEAKIKEMDGKMPYGGSVSYRHMCRYESGFFFRHNLTLKYDYYWRVEPGVQFHCDIDEDPFLYMKLSNKLYGFTMALQEVGKTIESLWSTTKDWLNVNKNNLKLPKQNSLSFVSDTFGFTYNLCHFWSNFEIASFKLWRDPQYLSYFDHLDKIGGSSTKGGVTLQFTPSTLLLCWRNNRSTSSITSDISMRSSATAQQINLVI